MTDWENPVTWEKAATALGKVIAIIPGIRKIIGKRKSVSELKPHELEQVIHALETISDAVVTLGESVVTVAKGSEAMAGQLAHTVDNLSNVIDFIGRLGERQRLTSDILRLMSNRISRIDGGPMLDIPPDPEPMPTPAKPKRRAAAKKTTKRKQK